jgi:hypothetical protein
MAKAAAVARSHRHAHDEVHEIAPAGVAHPHAAQLDLVFGLRQRGPDPVVGVGDRAVHQHVDGGLRKAERRENHERGDEERGDSVGARVARANEQETHEHCDRAGEVGREVESVCRKRGGPVAARGPEARERARGVDRDHYAEHGEGPPGHVDFVAAPVDQPPERLEPDPERDEHQERALAQRGQMLRLAVAVVMLAVRRADRHAHGEQRKERGHEVGAGMGRLGDERERAGGEARDELDRDEEDGGGHAERGRPLARAGVGGRVHLPPPRRRSPKPPRSERSGPAGRSSSAALSRRTTSARAARPRWLIASFSSGVSSAIVRSSPG